MKLNEMDERLRQIERTGTPQEALRAKLRAGEPVKWYRACTACEDWETHPQIVCPTRGEGDAGPIGALKVDDYWVEMCFAEHEKYKNDADALKFASSVLYNPDPID